MNLKDKLNLLLNEHTVEVLQDYKSEGNTAFYIDMAQADIIEDLLHVLAGYDVQQDILHDMAWNIFGALQRAKIQIEDEKDKAMTKETVE